MKQILIFALTLFTLQAHSAQVRFENFRGGEESYVFAIIRPTNSPEASTTANQELAHTLLGIANNWFFDQLLARYVHADAEELAAKLEPMRAQGIHLNEGSSFILVFKASDPRAPIGTLWTYYPDANGQIDLQKDLDSKNWRYPVSPPTFGEYPVFKIDQGGFTEIETQPLLRGGVVEMKRFALDPKSPRGLMLAMLLRGESYEHLNTQSLKLNGIGRAVPAEYALRCNHALIPIYTRLGFKRVAGDPTNEMNEDYIMKISRADYVKNAYTRLNLARQSGWDIRFEKPSEAHSQQIETHVRATLSVRTCRDRFAR